MTKITKWNDTGVDMFCKSQLITCNRVKECNGVCPFEDALKHADKMQTMNKQHTIDHDRDWIIGCIEHDGFIHTHRFDKANQIIHDALSAEAEWIPCSERLPDNKTYVLTTIQVSGRQPHARSGFYHDGFFHNDNGDTWGATDKEVRAWMPLPKPYKGGEK